VRYLSSDSWVIELADLPIGCHAHRQVESGACERSPIPTGQTHLMTFELLPAAQHELHVVVAGDLRKLLGSPQNARTKAENHLLESAWEVLEFVDHDVVTRGTTSAM
jgi:hypothetical protein